MLRRLLRRFGIHAVLLGMTATSILLSIGITWGLNLFFGDGPVGKGWVMAVVAPLLIAPIMSLQLLHLLSKLDRAEERLKALSYTDELTQTYNRRFFMKYVDKELKRIQRTGEHFSVAILDMDNFKQINDEHGHLAGDHVLRELTGRLRQQMRQSDILARYGGDEFIMLFPQTNPEQMEAWVRRMYETVARNPIDFHGYPITPLFSLGVSFSEPGMHDTDELLKAADTALYEAKREGGDRYRLAPTSIMAEAQTS